MMDFAQCIDDRNKILSKPAESSHKPQNSTKSFPSNRTISWEPPAKTTHPKTLPINHSQEITTKQPSNNRGRAFKRLSDTEMQDKLTKGLFRCDEQFVPGHVCANKQLHVLLIKEEVDSVDSNNVDIIANEFLNLHLSMFSISGFTTKTTIKLWGEIEGQKVIVLIDCGASHNFISTLLVEETDLLVVTTRACTVEVGDGRKIPCEGLCEAVCLQMQGLVVQQDFYVFDLGGVDIILGMDWLAQLGEIRANFGELTLQIPTKEGCHVLR